VCVRDPWWGFTVTGKLICTPSDVQAGERVLLSLPDKVPAGVTVYGPLGHTVASTPGP
jgi:hypothetical protein